MRSIVLALCLVGCDAVPPLDFEGGMATDGGGSDAEGGASGDCGVVGATCCNDLPCIGALCCGQCTSKCMPGDVCCGTTGTIVCKKIGMSCN